MDIRVFQTGILNVNTYIVPLCDNYVFVVDPANCTLSGDENLVTDFLKTNHLECVAVILTHGHFDHISGIRQIKDAFPNTKIAIHQRDQMELDNPPGEINEFILHNFGLSQFVEILKRQPAATHTLIGEETLEVLGDEKTPEKLMKALSQWKVILTPGHSPGCICLYNELGAVLISGDTLFADGYGRTDFPGGDEAQIGRSLALLEERIPGGTYICPGHGARVKK